jgi:Tfp pilus assembly protein FimV
MSTQRQRALRSGPPAARAEKRHAVDEYPARLFPIQHEIQKLQKELKASNERIAELKKM